MQVMTFDEIGCVGGGEVGATGMGGNAAYAGSTANAVGCANSMMAWGGLGATIGGLGGGLGGLLGSLVGGALAANYSSECK